jgi:sulfur carrier protein ThiS
MFQLSDRMTDIAFTIELTDSRKMILNGIEHGVIDGVFLAEVMFMEIDEQLTLADLPRMNMFDEAAIAPVAVNGNIYPAIVAEEFIGVVSACWRMASVRELLRIIDGLYIDTDCGCIHAADLKRRKQCGLDYGFNPANLLASIHG